jgi:hypothetical protein
VLRKCASNVDELVATIIPQQFDTIASWYDDYTPVWRRRSAGSSRPPDPRGDHERPPRRFGRPARRSATASHRPCWAMTPACNGATDRDPWKRGALTAEFGGPDYLADEDEPASAEDGARTGDPHER